MQLLFTVYNTCYHFMLSDLQDMQLVFTVNNTYCHLMLSDLQDTTKNLKTLDHMLDNYRDVSRDQRSTNDRVSLESFPLKYPFI